MPSTHLLINEEMHLAGPGALVSAYGGGEQQSTKRNGCLGRRTPMFGAGAIVPASPAHKVWDDRPSGPLGGSTG